MTKLVPRVIDAVSRASGCLRSRARPGLRIVLYHSVGATLGLDRLGLSIPLDAFSGQMRWLREESGLEIVSLAAGVARLESGTLVGTAVAVTFDDGYRDNLTVAAPVLARYRIPFTVFLVGRFLALPPASGRYLDPTAVRELLAVPGAAVGAHGQSHRPLTRLGDRELSEELGRSAAAVAEISGEHAGSLSYPHGAIDDRVADFVERAGFSVGATSLLGVNRRGVGLLRLRRTEISARDAIGSFARKVRGDYDWYQVKQRLYWPIPAGSGIGCD